MPLEAIFAQRGDTFGAAADPTLLTRLDLKIGDRITIGNVTMELRASLFSSAKARSSSSSRMFCMPMRPASGA